MTDLNPKARAILEAARDAAVFTSTDRARIKHGVLSRLATLGAAGATASSAVAMSLSAKIALVALSATVVGGGVASLSLLRERTPAGSPVTRPQPSPQHTAAATPAPMPASKPGIATPAPLVGRSESVSRPSKRPSRAIALHTEAPAPDPISPPVIPPLDAELKVLRQARADLRDGRPGDAFQRLADFDRGHTRGGLAQERRALAAIAHCQWRPGPEAQARAAAFLRDAPESPLIERVRSACGRANRTGK